MSRRKKPAGEYRIANDFGTWIAWSIRRDPPVWGPHQARITMECKYALRGYRVHTGVCGRTPFEALERLKRQLERHVK